MSPKVTKFCGVFSVEIKDKFGGSLIAIGEAALESFHKEQLIDNLDYIEALVILRQIKTKGEIENA